MSSSNNGSFFGSLFTFLFLVFLVWMICSPKKESFIEFAVDDYKVELFGKRFVKVENIRDSRGIDSLDIIPIVRDSTAKDSTEKPIVPTPESDFGIIEEFEYSNENDF